MHFIFPIFVMGYLCTNCAMPLYGIMYTGLGGKPPFPICILYIVTLMKVFPMRERERERERESARESLEDDLIWSIMVCGLWR